MGDYLGRMEKYPVMEKKKQFLLLSGMCRMPFERQVQQI